MRLSDLLSDATPGLAYVGPGDIEVTRVVSDSRLAEPGALFVASRGLTVDGHQYISTALGRGAVAIVAQRPAPSNLSASIGWLQVEQSAPLLGPLAAALHGHPSRAMSVLAVTGTNGKTTVAWILDQILRQADAKPGLLGTVEIRFGDVRRPSAFTTPLANQLQELLAEMRDAGCTHVVLEASSHGLAMHRLSGVEVAVGGFTNLSRDHIDYHGTMEAYRAAKATLFEGMARAACFNVDDATGSELAAHFVGPRRTISVAGAPADLSLEALTCTVDGSRAQLAGVDDALDIPLIGRHNVENALVALGMAELAGVPREEAIAALAHVSAAPGRLEPVAGPRHVLVDYAHTPDALANVLEVLRPMVTGRLICVFGAGGDRDRGKRPQMGAAAARLADVAVVTSDNPRSEAPEAIIDDILAGVPEGVSPVVELDRRRAIHRAVALAEIDDLVLIAGKGHETYQIVGDTRLDFDDRLVAAEALGVAA